MDAGSRGVVGQEVTSFTLKTASLVVAVGAAITHLAPSVNLRTQLAGVIRLNFIEERAEDAGAGVRADLTPLHRTTASSAGVAVLVVAIDAAQAYSPGAAYPTAHHLILTQVAIP